MIKLNTPRGLSVEVPENEQEDPSPKFAATQANAIKSYYEQNGYVIVRGLLPAQSCDRMRDLWASEIKVSNVYIYRQTSTKLERHVINSNGWVMNPILNIQSVNPSLFPGFRKFATENILTSSELSNLFTVLLGERPKIVQSMYFEGNSATREHQDGYYLDSERSGAMAAAWIALEDIAADAGRFFVCPGSHKINLSEHAAASHDDYIEMIVDKVEDLGYPIRAPALKKGDVLFWNAWTIHGSLDSQSVNHSRSSITCHAIPDSHRFRVTEHSSEHRYQMQSQMLDLPTDLVNGIRIHRAKDLARPKYKLVFFLETNFPAVAQLLKSAVKYTARAKD